jgi:PEP-CTERM motif
MADEEWLKRPPFTLERGAVLFRPGTLQPFPRWNFLMGPVRCRQYEHQGGKTWASAFPEPRAIRNHRDSAIDMYVGLQVVARAGAAPIPEPSSWALLLVGLSSVGAASAWRRRIGSK